MDAKLIIAGAVGALVGAAAISTAAPELNLRGDRFRPLSYDELAPAQRALADRDLAAPSRSGGGPLNIYLRSPEFAELARPLSQYLRFKAPFPEKLKELAIMMTGRFWGGTYVWYRQHGRLSGIVQPTSSFKDPAGRVCRHILLIMTVGTARGRAEGIACRLGDGRWQLVAGHSSKIPDVK